MRVGIVGAGGMGNVHARHYRSVPGVETVLYDRSEEAARTVAERWGCTVAGSLDGLLSKVDIVDICLPTDMHLDLGLKAIAAGKAVLIEKPMAATVEECSRLIEAAERTGVLLMPAMVVRQFAEYRRAHELVKDGAVGKPAAARLRRGGGAPQGSAGWFRDHARSGGVLLDLAVHDFDWLRWTLGEVSLVFSRSVRLGESRLGEDVVGDYALTTLTHDSGCISHVESTWMDPSGFRTTLEVCGSEGMIQHDSRLNPTLRTHSGGASRPESNMDPSDDPYFRQLSGFVEAVRSGSEPPVSAYDGLMAVSIASAAIESASTGRAIKPARP